MLEIEVEGGETEIERRGRRRGKRQRRGRRRQRSGTFSSSEKRDECARRGWGDREMAMKEECR